MRHHLPFPQNLTPGERRALEAVIEHGTHTEAARQLGVKECTVYSQLWQARMKADVSTIVQLVVKYLRATETA